MRFSKCLFVAVVSFALAACDWLPLRARVVPDPARLVYAAVLDSLIRGAATDTLLMRDSTAVFRMPGSNAVASWRMRFDSLPAELPPLLDAASRTRLPSAALAIPRPMRTFSIVELRKIFAGGPEEGWRDFYERFPRQRRYIGLSPVVFSRDGKSALLYFEMHCGSRCGEGDAVWLTRSKDGRWGVRQVLMLWVS